MIWTKEQFDRVFNNDDIKNWNSHQILHGILTKERMIKEIECLAGTSYYHYIDPDKKYNTIVENSIRRIIALNFLEGVPYVPKFWLDYGYALYSLNYPIMDYLKWWNNEKYCTSLKHFEPYRGMRFHEYLKQCHHCDWGKIAMKMKPIHYVNKNAKPNFR